MSHKRKIAMPTLQINNERVIVTEWYFSAGAETTWHCHEYDYIVVPQTTGTLSIETEDGISVSNLITGKSYSRMKGIEHNVINNNEFEFVFVEIELK